jgi:ubiquinol-cytochrome c reductase cytochrome c1 subunit
MRELKILAVLVVFTGLLYFGVEPYAHTQLHKHVDAPEYTFSDVDGLKGTTGNAQAGEALVQANCIACHSMEKIGFPKLVDDATSAASYGVTPPDLVTSGLLYNADYLAAFIKNPAKATQTEHKFKDGAVHPMPNYDWMSPQEIADMVAYLQSIAPKSVTNKEAFVDACQRCHAIKYGDMLNGTMGAFTPDDNIMGYMGAMPPDLSQYIKSRSEQYLHEFINAPQKHLDGTAMPRVGLTKAAEDQVVNYMIEVGDSSRDARNELGPKFLIYLLIFAVFAWLWKAKIWRDLH